MKEDYPRQSERKTFDEALAEWLLRAIHEPDILLDEIQPLSIATQLRAVNEILEPAKECADSVAMRYLTMRQSITDMTQCEDPNIAMQAEQAEHRLEELEQADEDEGDPFDPPQQVRDLLSTHVMQEYYGTGETDSHVTLVDGLKALKILIDVDPTDTVHCITQRGNLVYGELNSLLSDLFLLSPAEIQATHYEAVKRDFNAAFEALTQTWDTKIHARFDELDRSCQLEELQKRYKEYKKAVATEMRLSELSPRSVLRSIVGSGRGKKLGERMRHTAYEANFLAAGSDVEGMDYRELYDFRDRSLPEAPEIYHILCRRLYTLDTPENTGNMVRSFIDLIQQAGDNTRQTSSFTLGELARNIQRLYPYYHPDSRAQLSPRERELTENRSISIFLEWLKSLIEKGRVAPK